MEDTSQCTFPHCKYKKTLSAWFTIWKSVQNSLILHVVVVFKLDEKFLQGSITKLINTNSNLWYIIHRLSISHCGWLILKWTDSLALERWCHKHTIIIVNNFPILLIFNMHWIIQTCYELIIMIYLKQFSFHVNKESLTVMSYSVETLKATCTRLTPLKRNIGLIHVLKSSVLCAILTYFHWI